MVDSLRSKMARGFKIDLLLCQIDFFFCLCVSEFLDSGDVFTLSPLRLKNLENNPKLLVLTLGTVVSTPIENAGFSIDSERVKVFIWKNRCDCGSAGICCVVDCFLLFRNIFFSKCNERFKREYLML